jgi:glycosyltransferase involved in cell wall biosynthesis
MLLTFIIPVFNTGDYIARCVDSILNSSLSPTDYEIILVNDGSTDNSFEIINQFTSACKSARCITQENRGLGAARNLGLREAKGRYVFFVDSDDYVVSENLSVLAAYAENCQSEVILFESVCRKDNRKDSILNHRPELIGKTFSGEYYLRGYNLQMSVWSCLFLRDFLIRNRLQMPEGIFHEDELFLPTALLKAVDMSFFPKKVYVYNLRDNSITGNKSKGHVEKRIRDFVFVINCLHQLSSKDSLSLAQQTALNRRVHFLVVDLAVNLIKGDASDELVGESLSAMRDLGLFPLRRGWYSWKYIFFRYFIRSEKFVSLLTRFYRQESFF